MLKPLLKIIVACAIIWVVFLVLLSIILAKANGSEVAASSFKEYGLTWYSLAAVVVLVIRIVLGTVDSGGKERTNAILVNPEKN
jgi:succinate-acetate transporter protein